MGNKTFGIVTFAILIEALITYYKEFFAGGGSSWEIIVSLILGITVAVSYKLDLLSNINLKTNTYLILLVITVLDNLCYIVLGIYGTLSFLIRKIRGLD